MREKSAIYNSSPKRLFFSGICDEILSRIEQAIIKVIDEKSASFTLYYQVKFFFGLEGLLYF